MSASVTTQNQDRILTFLSLLDDDVAEHMLRSMDPEVAQQIRELLANSRHRRPSAKTQLRVLEEFDRFFKFAIKFSKPALKVHNPNKLAEDAPGYELSENAIDDLEHMNAHQLTSALEEESARTCAILMKEMSPARNAEILALMRADLRDLVIRELSTNAKAPRVLVLQIARTTVERASTLPPERVAEPDSVQRLAEVLRATDKKNRRNMLKSLQQQDPEMTLRVQKQLYRFEDLLEMNDPNVRAVLGKVETATISTALFGCDERIMDKVMSNLSRRARETLQEELSFLSRIPESQLAAARETVVEAIAEVEMESQ